MLSNTHHVLKDVLNTISCKPDWVFYTSFRENALRLIISVTGPDAASPDNELTVSHFFPVPEATYNDRAWTRWVFECCRLVENHELGEWFRLNGTHRPFAPLHGPGENPYMVVEYREDTDRRTRQDGEIV